MFYLFNLIFFLFGTGLLIYVRIEVSGKYFSKHEKLPELVGKQKLFFDTIISSKKDFFITGKARTSKSIVLKHLRGYYDKQKISYVVTVP